MRFLNIVRRFLGKPTVKNAVKNEILTACKSLLGNHTNIIFDIGAHHGRFSLEVPSYFEKSKIYCFEPSPESFRALERNLEKTSCHLSQLALSDKASEMDFYINEFEETNSLLPSKITGSDIDRLTSQKDIIKVQVSTIDKFCSEEKIDSIGLLKIDVQGNTLNTLRGAESLLRSKKIKVIYCEIEFLQIYKNQSLFHHVTAYLETFQYSLYSIYNIHYDVNNRISWADALYIID
jgi:FkbM family methyltransferase